jgi:hypothetical protein
VNTPTELARLRAIASDYRLLVLQATQLRERRDNIALYLIDAGETWRDVADAAGFENPYIAELKRKRRASLAPMNAVSRIAEDAHGLRGSLPET